MWPCVLIYDIVDGVYNCFIRKGKRTGKTLWEYMTHHRLGRKTKGDIVTGTIKRVLVWSISTILVGLLAYLLLYLPLH